MCGWVLEQDKGQKLLCIHCSFSKFGIFFCLFFFLLGKSTLGYLRLYKIYRKINLSVFPSGWFFLAESRNEVLELIWIETDGFCIEVEEMRKSSSLVYPLSQMSQTLKQGRVQVPTKPHQHSNKQEAPYWPLLITSLS